MCHVMILILQLIHEHKIWHRSSFTVFYVPNSIGFVMKGKQIILKTLKNSKLSVCHVLCSRIHSNAMPAFVTLVLPDPLFILHFSFSLSPNFWTLKELRNRFQGINSASLWSLGGRYDNPIPTRFRAPIVCFKIPPRCHYSACTLVEIYSWH